MTRHNSQHHRVELFDIGWLLMDLRQDIEASIHFGTELDLNDVVRRLGELQNRTGEYADKHFPYNADLALRNDPNPEILFGPTHF